MDRARRKAIELQANRAGIETVRENVNGQGHTVAEAFASYSRDMEPPQREPEAYTAYKHCLELFSSNCEAFRPGREAGRCFGLHSQTL